MINAWSLPHADEPTVRRLAEGVALKLRAGDMIALHGDLGAGKTTFARALIRGLLADGSAEVPSPTFPILQTYETPRLVVSHLDLYRVAGESEAQEIGIGELLQAGAIVVEWPDKAPNSLGHDRLDITFSDTGLTDTRNLVITAQGSWGARAQRLKAMFAFLDGLPDWRTASLSYLQGDASARGYAKLDTGLQRAILMDWPPQPDGPPIRDGLPYSRIAHLAEGLPAFCDIGNLLLAKGYSAPRMFAEDRTQGFLVLEDLGDHVYGREIAAGRDMRELWRAGVDTLIEMRELIGISEIDGAGGARVRLPDYDRSALGIETELLLDWYWPMIKGAAVSAQARSTFLALWQPLFDRVLAEPGMLVLRDYHSPNMLWLPDRPEPKRRVGIIDFQDGVIGHPAYDLVSLLQDARLDVPEEIERDLLSHYLERVAAREAKFDREAFTAAYAILGAQRNSKILGIFARLAKRDGKPGYLRHMPRVWGYTERCLAHPQLAAVRAWYDANFPPALRARVLEAG